MVNNVKISIIVPVYNVESYIEECLLSLQNQTFKDFEVILINDGSTDNSGKICDKFSSIDSRFRTFHKKNGGVNTARKKGIEKAVGEYITFMDADDLFPLNALENLYTTAEELDLDICVGGQYEWKQKTPLSNVESIVYQYEKKYEEIFNIKDLDYIDLYENIWFMVFGGKLFKRKLFKNQYIATSLKYGEDQICIKEILFKSNKISVIPYYTYIYRRRTGSATTKRNKNAFDIFESFDFLEKVFTDYGYIKKEYSNIVNWALKSYWLHMKYFLPYCYWYSFISKIAMYAKNLDIENLDTTKLEKQYKKLIIRFSESKYIFFWKIYYIFKIFMK